MEGTESGKGGMDGRGNKGRSMSFEGSDKMWGPAELMGMEACSVLSWFRSRRYRRMDGMACCSRVSVLFRIFSFQIIDNTWEHSISPEQRSELCKFYWTGLVFCLLHFSFRFVKKKEGEKGQSSLARSKRTTTNCWYWLIFSPTIPAARGLSWILPAAMPQKNMTPSIRRRPWGKLAPQNPTGNGQSRNSIKRG